MTQKIEGGREGRKGEIKIERKEITEDERHVPKGKVNE
jgi:hypothetical protein